MEKNHLIKYMDYVLVAINKLKIIGVRIVVLKYFNKNLVNGNEYIDKFIQDAQLKARNKREVIEWIPYNRLSNIQYLAKGGFSTIYKAIWLDGPIDYLVNENKQWGRYPHSLEDECYENTKNEKIKSPLNENEKYGLHVVLKSLHNSSNINEEFLNEVNHSLQ